MKKHQKIKNKKNKTNNLLPSESCSLKQIFAQCKIISEGTLIVSNVKMINKILILPPGKISADAMNDRVFSLSFFRYFRAFTHYELFVSFRSLN